MGTSRRAKTLFPSELGELLINSLKGRFRFVEYDYTRELEQQLDEIAKGNAAFLGLVSALDKQLQVELAQLHIVPTASLHTPSLWRSHQCSCV